MQNELLLERDDIALTADTLVLESEFAEDKPTEPHNAEADSIAEVSEVLQGFKDRAKADAARFVDATDSEYWTAICFQTREQKEEFLTKIGLNLTTDGDKYLDGMLVAKLLGIELTSPVPKAPTIRRDSAWDEFVLERSES